MPSRQLIGPLEEGLRAVSLTLWPVARPALNLELGFSKGKSLRGVGVSDPLGVVCFLPLRLGEPDKPFHPRRWRAPSRVHWVPCLGSLQPKGSCREPRTPQISQQLLDD